MCIDVPLILHFIKELAAYEKASHEVEATESSLLQTLSFPSTEKSTSSSSTQPPKHGSVYTFLAIPPNSPDQKPVGMAMFFYNYSTWRSAPGVYLEDLFVQPEHRGSGCGLALFRALAKEVRRIGGKRLEWVVLKWNEPSIRFYKALGARDMEEWTKMMVEGDEALARLAEEGE